MITDDLKARYIGALRVLAECGVQVDEDTRESIDMVLSHAQSCGDIVYKQVWNRFDIELVNKPPKENSDDK